MTRKTANALLLLTGAIWGMAFVAQQSAMDKMPAMLFVALRFLLAAVVVAPFALREYKTTGEAFAIRHRVHATILGVVFFLGMGTQQLGLLGTSVTNAGFLTTLYVVLVPVLLFVVVGKRQRPAVWLSAVVSLIGIYLLSGSNLASINWGDWLVVLCSLFWAIHVILVGRFSGQTRRPIALAAMQFFVCGCLATLAHVFSSVVGWTQAFITAESLVAALPEIAFAGVVAGGLAFTLQVVAQRHTTASVAAILMGTESLFAAVFGAIFRDDRLSQSGYLGCALIFGAVLVVELVPPAAATQEESGVDD